MRGCLLLFVFTLGSAVPVDFGPTPFHFETTPVGCFYNNRWYRPGEEISHGQTGNWCYFTMCDHSGQIIKGDDFNCHTTLTTTTPIYFETTRAGCFYDGNWYSLGEVISHGQSGNWCYSTMCDHTGQIIHGDDFNCMTTTATTTPADQNHFAGK
ncbi:hypothetical protein ACJMK2_032378 [Sinanodonta woodiana]|uniref:Uncharacterized protein n=1 Tax=Sinanodonta woodiana TaxID=1069815 RepID=A0ABD3X1J4_SINWO